jgi:MFS family permease
MVHQVSLPRSLLIASGARSFATGLTGVLLGLYLGQLGLGAGTLGLVVGSGLAGLAVGTTLVAFVGDRFGRRRTLLVTTVLSCAGLVGVALSDTALGLAITAFLGMVNGMGRDRGPAQALEQSLLAVPRRTHSARPPSPATP